MTDSTDFTVDKHWVKAGFGRAAGSYDEAAVLQAEINRRMLERLQPIRLNPEWFADIGTGTGQAIDALLERFPKARMAALDIAHGMLRRAASHGRWLRRPALVCADAEHLPFAGGSLDLIYSGCTLQWCSDLKQTFAEFRRVLAPGGLVIFSTFGPDTLRELRASWAAVDDRVHVNEFIDMHDVGDALLTAGFSDPVMEMEMLEVTYTDVSGLLRDLRAIGAQNRATTRRRALTGRQRMKAMYAAYEAYRKSDGRLPASYEVIYGHAWQLQSTAMVGPASADGNIYVPVANLRQQR